MQTDHDLPELADAMARLRDSIDVPPIDPRRERKLIAAFDNRRAASSPRSVRFGRLMWAATVALVTLVASLNWFVGRRPTTPTAPPADAVVDLTGFVAWPGASAWPRLESGSLVRVDLPVSVLPSLGFAAPASSITVVEADVVVGQDGLARAVRLVRQQ